MRIKIALSAMVAAASFAVAGAATAAPVSHEPAATSKAARSGAVLTYGASITLKNGWNGGQGGYLDTNQWASGSGAKLDVSTAHTPDRSNGGRTGIWKVLSASGKNDGTPVMSGDKVWLVNEWNGEQGGYLDTNGRSNKRGAKLEVSTTDSQVRIDDSAKWRLLAESSDPRDGRVRVNDTVHLLNDWADAQGGFLDTNGRSNKRGAKLEVSTSPYSDRGNDSGSWTINTAP